MDSDLIDEIELDILAQFGDVDMAEAAGLAVRFTWEMLFSLLGLSDSIGDIYG